MSIQHIPLYDYTTGKIITSIYYGKRPEPVPSAETKSIKAQGQIGDVTSISANNSSNACGGHGGGAGASASAHADVMRPTAPKPSCSMRQSKPSHRPPIHP
jgi:hypothetical protein